MSRHHHAAAVLRELGAEMGLGEFGLDGSDRASLLIDHMPVTFSYTAEPVELLWLHADLGEVPAEGRAAPECALQLALMAWAANAMTVGLDEDGKKALGYSAIAVSMLDLGALKELLARLLDAARPIRERLAARRFDIDLNVATAADAGGVGREPQIRA